MSAGRFIHSSPFPKVKLPVVSLPRFLFDRVERHPYNKAAYIDGLTGNTVTFGHFLGTIPLSLPSNLQKWCTL